ncbi:MAG: RNA polymerase sigma factor [Ginsengibacter sp.]
MHTESGHEIKTLIKQIAEDDEAAFKTIFDHYKAPFYSAAFKMTRSGSLAEEIVQEVFVKIWVKRKLIATAKRPADYIFTILHNCIYAQFRKLALEDKLKTTLARDSEESEDSIQLLLLEKENKAILENIINQMPARQRLIYKLAKQEGWSREEIARRLNISPNTVRNHLAAAIEFLRNYFRKNASIIIWTAIWMSL